MVTQVGSSNFQGTPEEVHEIHNLMAGIIPAYADNKCSSCDKCECDICDVNFQADDEYDEQDALVE